MNDLKKIEKYEKSLKIALFCVEHNKNINLTKLRKDLKINKNFITALSKLEIIKNNGTHGTRNYVLLKKYSPELALEVLKFANKLSLNKKEVEIVVTKNKTLFQKFLDFFKY
jgi:hypothetical protein